MKMLPLLVLVGLTLGSAAPALAGQCTDLPLMCPNGQPLSPLQLRPVVVDGCAPIAATNPAVSAALSNWFVTFRPACDDHARCYGGATSGTTNLFAKTRGMCDDVFKSAMNTICATKPTAQRAPCMAAQLTLYTAAHNFGCSLFAQRRKATHC